VGQKCIWNVLDLSATMDPPPWRSVAAIRRVKLPGRIINTGQPPARRDNRRMTDKPDVPPLPLCSLDRPARPWQQRGFRAPRPGAVCGTPGDNRIFVYENPLPAPCIHWNGTRPVLDNARALIPRAPTHGALFYPKVAIVRWLALRRCLSAGTRQHISDGQLWLD